MACEETSYQALITTIIPTYQRPNFLKRAINSVLNQTFKNFTILVCDNGADQETQDLMEEWVTKDSRITYIRHSKNIGLENNFLFGLNHVQTPYFSFLSDDDWLFPWFYENSLNKFTNHPSAMFAANPTLTVNHEGKVCETNPMENWEDKCFYEPPHGLLPFLGYRGTWTGILFRKEIVSKIGSLDPNVGIAFDGDFILRAAAQCAYCYSKLPCAVFYLHKMSATSCAQLGSIWPGFLKLIDNVVSPVESAETRKKTKQFLHSYLKKSLIVMMFQMIFAKKIVQAKEVSEILETNYSHKASARLLKIYTKLPSISFILRGAIKIRRAKGLLKFKKKARLKALQRQFNNQLSCL